MGIHADDPSIRILFAVGSQHLIIFVLLALSFFVPVLTIMFVLPVILDHFLVVVQKLEFLDFMGPLEREEKLGEVDEDELFVWALDDFVDDALEFLDFLLDALIIVFNDFFQL